MRSKILLTVLLVITGMGLMAQSLDKAKDLFKANKLPDAKAEIDKVLTVEKNQKSPEAWFYKLKIYNALAAADSAKGQYPDARHEAYEALIKYTQADNEKKLILLTLDNYKAVNDIYAGFFQTGANDYNAGKFAEALANFKGALESGAFMNSKGWAKIPFDTTATLYAGISAEKAGDKDTAANYYGALALTGITKLNGSDMLGIDKWLVDHYYQKKDEPNMYKFLALGEKGFPDDLYWPTFELDYLREKGNKDSLFAKYEQITAQFPKNHLYFFNYGLELYEYATDTSSGKRPDHADSLIGIAQKNLARSLELQPDYAHAALVLGQVLFNLGVDLQGQAKLVKGKTPDDIKKRTDLRAAANKKFDESVPYFEKVDTLLGSKGKLKQDDKTALKNAYDLLTTIYEQKKVQDKLDYWQAKYNDVDKVH